MKVLMINGSANVKGCTYTALKLIEDELNKHNIDTEIVSLGNKPIRDCMGCGTCRKTASCKCVFDDDIINSLIEKAKIADGFVFGSPVYYAHPAGRLLTAMDRMFYAGGEAFRYKPAAAIVSARRSGTTASLDAIMKHFTINCMPVVSSNYWNMVHGNCPEEVVQDKEGIQIMNLLGQNMAWLLQCVELGKKYGINHPQLPEKVKTNFIR
ncbi:MAG: flavodoxin family protein [Candidatus Gastranaerophilaceae bacterium]